MAAKYVFGFVGGKMPETEEEQAKVMEVWGAWFGSLGEAIVDPGNPFGPSASIAADGTVGGSATSGLTGYTVVSADSLETATGMAKGCPIFDNGGSVDIFETIDM